MNALTVDQVAEQRVKAAEQGDWETYRLLLPVDHPYRHELESPLHEDACVHMAPGCPCEGSAS